MKTDNKLKILFVTKPMAPPWNDSSKNLAYHLASHLEGSQITVMGQKNQRSWHDNVTVSEVFSEPGSFTPSLIQNLRSLWFLIRNASRFDIVHFFFLPNIRTIAIMKLLTHFWKSKTVHTWTAAPKELNCYQKLIFCDATVTLSNSTSKLLPKNADTFHIMIPPCAKNQENLSASSSSKPDKGLKLLYPGDYETGGAMRSIIIFSELIKSLPNAQLLLACRSKSPKSKECEIECKTKAVELGIRDSITFIGETPSIIETIQQSNIILFPVKTLYRKMDLPMVLIESMHCSKPIITSDLEPLKEMLQDGAGLTISYANTQAWVDQIISLSSKQRVLDDLGKAALERAQEIYTCKKMASAYQHLYMSLIETSPNDQEKNASKQVYYNQFSKSYESRRHTGYHALIDDIEANIVRNHTKTGALLEVGCGTGLIMKRLVSSEMHVEGLDLSPGMLEKAKEKGLSVRQGSAENISDEDNSFDCTYSFKVLAHVKDIKKALSEMSRVTKPGGYVIAEFYNKWSLRGLRWIIRKYLFYMMNSGKQLTEKDIYTRYDSWKQFRSYVPSDLEPVTSYGVISITPAAFFIKIPLIGKFLSMLERNLYQSFLHCFSGFGIVVYRKKN